MKKCCLDDTHKLHLEQYYCDIVSTVIYAESFLPKTNPNFQRSFWNDELEHSDAIVAPDKKMLIRTLARKVFALLNPESNSHVIDLKKFEEIKDFTKEYHCKEGNFIISL